MDAQFEAAQRGAQNALAGSGGVLETDLEERLLTVRVAGHATPHIRVCVLDELLVTIGGNVRFESWFDSDTEIEPEVFRLVNAVRGGVNVSEWQRGDEVVVAKAIGIGSKFRATWRKTSVPTCLLSRADTVLDPF